MYTTPWFNTAKAYARPHVLDFGGSNARFRFNLGSGSIFLTKCKLGLLVGEEVRLTSWPRGLKGTAILVTK